MRIMQTERRIAIFQKDLEPAISEVLSDLMLDDGYRPAFIDGNIEVREALADAEADAFIMQLGYITTNKENNLRLVDQVNKSQELLNGRPVIFLTLDGGEKWDNFEQEFRRSLPDEKQFPIVHEPFDIFEFVETFQRAIATTKDRRIITETLAEVAAPEPKPSAASTRRDRRSRALAPVTSIPRTKRGKPGR